MSINPNTKLSPFEEMVLQLSRPALQEIKQHLEMMLKYPENLTNEEKEITTRAKTALAQMIIIHKIAETK